MKKIVLLLFGAALVFGFSAAKMFERAAADVLQQLGIPVQLGKECVWSSFSGGYFAYPQNPEIKQTPNSGRASIVQKIGAFAKSYTQSEEFKNKYLEHRESMKPLPPEPPRSMAETRRAQKEELQKSLRDAEQTKKALPADQRAVFDETIKMLKEQVKAIEDPNNPMYSKEMEEMNKQSYAAQMEEYKSKLADWEQKYPTDPSHMIKQRLAEFLEVSKNVDYNAAVMTDERGKKVFTNLEYEQKPSNWKLCFRAGKETVEAGRAFAKQWLNELNKAK